MKKFLICGLTLCTLLSATSLFAQTPEQINLEPISTTSESIVSPQSAGGGVVTADNVNFRKSPGLSGSVICKLNDGDILDEVDDNYTVKDGYNWYRAKYNGQWGYIADIYFEHRQ